MKKIHLGLYGLLIIGLAACNKTNPVAPAKANAAKINISNNLHPIANDSLKVGLIAYYTFTGNATDSSGRHHDGTASNVTLTADRFGKPNSAYAFNGKNSFISVGDSGDLRLSNTDFTFNVWENLAPYDWKNLPAYGNALLVKRAGKQGWGTSIKNGGPFYNITADKGGEALAQSQVITGKWQMITVMYSAKLQKLSFYVDGVLKSSTAQLASPNASISSALYIGRDSQTDADHFKGSIDEIRIYNRNLSNTEVLNLFGKTK